MMNKEAIHQAEAFLKTNRSFYGEEGFQAYGPYGEKAVALMMAEFADQCAPVGEALQKMGIGKLRALLHAFDSEQISMSKFLEEINIHFLGGENYGTEASNTDEAAVVTPHSSATSLWDNKEVHQRAKELQAEFHRYAKAVKEQAPNMEYQEIHSAWVYYQLAALQISLTSTP